MEQNEAKKILDEQISKLRRKSYRELCTYLNIKNNQTIEVIGDSGKKYQIEITVVLDSKSTKNIRVIAAIDDGGWRSILPCSVDFIISPEGKFVGE